MELSANNAENRPLALAVISNPLAGGNRRALPAVRTLMQRYSDCRHYLAATDDEMTAVAEEVKTSPPDVLAINAGDGSIARILTLLCRQPPEPFPLLALVPGGTTNMSAADIGLAGRPDAALSRLIDWCWNPDAKRVRNRALLRLQPDNQPAHYGFFLGVGLIARAVALSLDQRAKARWPALVPPRLTLTLLWALFRGKRSLGDPITVMAQSADRSQSRLRIHALYATTLGKLLLGMRPFAGVAGEYSFYWGAVMPGIQSPWRTLPAYLWGESWGVSWGKSHTLITPENGFYRERLQCLSLGYSGEYMVDGELYPVGSVLKIASSAPLRFISA